MFINSYRYKKSVAQTITFTTNKNGTFNPSITSLDVVTWSVSGESDQTTNNPSFSLDGTDRAVTITTVDASLITAIAFNSQNIKGILDLSLLTGCTSFRTYLNAELTQIINPVSSAIISIYLSYNCGLTGVLDLSGLSGFGGNFQVSSNPSLNSIIFPNSSTPILNFNMQSCGLTGVIDASGLTGLGGDINFYLNSQLTQFIFPTSPQTITRLQGYNCKITGVFDLSGLTGLGGSLVMPNNTLMTSVLFPNSSNNFSSIRFETCGNGVLDWSPLTGVITEIQIHNNGMTSAEADENIVSIDNNLNLTTSLNIGGTNGALTDGSVTGFDGLQAKLNLEGEGVTVTAN